MALFKVLNIINGNTIDTDGWKWGDEYSGSKVIIAGLANTNENQNEFATAKLKELLEGKSVELRNPTNGVKGTGNNNDIITASVFLNEINIIEYL